MTDAATAGGSLADQLRVVAASREFRTLLTVFVLQALATGAMLAGVDYVARVLLGSPGASTILFVCFVAPALLVTPLWQRVGERRDKRTGYLWGSLLLAGGALATLLTVRVGVAATAASVAVVGVGYAACQMFPLAMLPDVAAADTARTGESRAGTYTGVWTAGETLGLALGPLLYAGVLALGGYVSSTDSAAVQPDSALTAIALGFTIIPAALVASVPAGAAHVPARPGGVPVTPPTAEDVLATLRELQAHDLPAHGGRTLAYVYDSGLADADAVGLEALAMFAASNGLDPTAFPSLLRMENDLVALTGGLLDAPDGFAGSVTSGGTESILLAVLAARHGSPGTTDPSMVLPTSVHAAFHKAAEFLGVRAVLVDVDPVTFAPTRTRWRLPSTSAPRWSSSRRRPTPTGSSTRSSRSPPPPPSATSSATSTPASAAGPSRSSGRPRGCPRSG